MKKVKLTLLLIFLIGGVYSYAQEPVIRTFSSQAYMQEIVKDDDLHYDLEKQFEKQINHFEQYGKLQDHVLPIVFHVVQTKGMPGITEEQINSQLEALNRDFNGTSLVEKHPNDPQNIYATRAGNALIQFCLPQTDLQGKKTSGFTATTTSSDWGDSFNAVKKITAPWPTQKFINVWVTDLKGKNAGYAQMPGGDPTLDGIVIDYKYFGQGGITEFPYDEGKTLTHLMGNYLGLYALWGEMECGDDYVDDTPIHNSINFTCPKFDHISTCDGYPTEMTMNFMDGTYDACRYLFTNGQIKRMQAVLAQGGIRTRLTETETQCTKPEIEFTEASIKDETETEIPEYLDIQLMPNPATDVVYIRFGEIETNDCIQLKVMDAGGKLMMEEEINHDTTEHRLVVKTLPPGIYFLNFHFDNHSITERLIVL